MIRDERVIKAVEHMAGRKNGISDDPSNGVRGERMRSLLRLVWLLPLVDAATLPSHVIRRGSSATSSECRFALPWGIPHDLKWYVIDDLQRVRSKKSVSLHGRCLATIFDNIDACAPA